MSEIKGFTIEISGLSAGKHLYEFPVSYSFFENFGNLQVLDASLIAEIELEKGGDWMNVNAYIHGTVTVECDRCLDKLELPVEVDSSVAVGSSKIVIENSEDDLDSMVIDAEDGELDLSQFIYDEICVSLPIQCVHNDGECNTEMINKLRNVEPISEDGELSIGNSPFNALKNLLDNKS